MEDSSAATSFNLLSELTLHKNVDRLTPFEPETSIFLAATYHLNKETQTKTGSL